jgi:hypothetical protein
MLERRAAPRGARDLSLLAGIPAMASFGRLLAAYAYARIATGRAHHDDVARCLTAFVVASALYDYACDREPDLLATLRVALPQGWLRAAFDGDAPGDPFAHLAEPVPVAYLGALGGYAAGLWRGLTSGRREGPARAHLDPLWERLAATHAAQLASVPDAAPHRLPGPADRQPSTARDVALIWTSPFVVALYTVAASPDAGPAPDLEALLPEAHRAGLLLSMVDDLADLEEDWRFGSANQYLDRACAAVRAPALPHGGTVPGGEHAAGADLPWQALLAEDVLTPYLQEILSLAATVREEDREAHVAWLMFWLGG